MDSVKASGTVLDVVHLIQLPVTPGKAPHTGELMSEDGVQANWECFLGKLFMAHFRNSKRRAMLFY